MRIRLFNDSFNHLFYLFFIQFRNIISFPSTSNIIYFFRIPIFFTMVNSNYNEIRGKRQQKIFLPFAKPQPIPFGGSKPIIDFELPRF